MAFRYGLEGKICEICDCKTGPLIVSYPNYPPTALGVTADALLGATPLKRAPKRDSRLHRRLQQLEQMPAKEKRQVLQVLDTFLERDRLKKQVAAARSAVGCFYL